MRSEEVGGTAEFWITGILSFAKRSTAPVRPLGAQPSASAGPFVRDLDCFGIGREEQVHRLAGLCDKNLEANDFQWEAVPMDGAILVPHDMPGLSLQPAESVVRTSLIASSVIALEVGDVSDRHERQVE